MGAETMSRKYTREQIESILSTSKERDALDLINNPSYQADGKHYEDIIAQKWVVVPPKLRLTDTERMVVVSVLCGLGLACCIGAGLVVNWFFN